LSTASSKSGVVDTTLLNARVLRRWSKTHAYGRMVS